MGIWELATLSFPCWHLAPRAYWPAGCQLPDATLEAGTLQSSGLMAGPSPPYGWQFLGEASQLVFLARHRRRTHTNHQRMPLPSIPASADAHIVTPAGPPAGPVAMPRVSPLLPQVAFRSGSPAFDVFHMATPGSSTPCRPSARLLVDAGTIFVRISPF